jgi:hypothetical protein
MFRGVTHHWTDIKFENIKFCHLSSFEDWLDSPLTAKRPSNYTNRSDTNLVHKLYYILFSHNSRLKIISNAILYIIIYFCLKCQLLLGCKLMNIDARDQ